MNPETLQTAQFLIFIIQLALLIAFFVLIADVRSIKNKMGAGAFAKRTDIKRALEKAEFMDNKDEVLSLYKELAFSEVNHPSKPVKEFQLEDLKEIAAEIKNCDGVIPSGLKSAITRLESKVNKK